MTAEELKEIRRRLGLTQKRLAAELGVDKMTVSRWERGLHAISDEYGQRTKILDIDVRQAEAQFVLLKEMVGPLGARDFLTCVTNWSPSEIEQVARRGRLHTPENMS